MPPTLPTSIDSHHPQKHTYHSKVKGYTHELGKLPHSTRFFYCQGGGGGGGGGSQPQSMDRGTQPQPSRGGCHLSLRVLTQPQIFDL